MIKASADSTKPAYPVAAVGNVLQLVRLLEERECLKLTDVSVELGIAPATAHRLLAMFRHYGFVEQDRPGRLYRVGPGLLEISQQLAARHAFLVRIRPILEALVGTLDETVHVATLTGTRVTYVDCVESRKAVRATPRIGRVMPAYATASGKALLAGLARAEIEARFPAEKLAPLTAHTLSTRTALLRDLDETTRRGFAINENESQLGFFACSSFVYTGPGSQPTALVLAGPSRRFRKHQSRFAERLCAAAAEAGRT